jgi:hypothetical protein
MTKPFLINTPRFYAGGEMVCGRVTSAAPVFRFMIGWTDKRVYDYCKKKGWKFHTIDHEDLIKTTEIIKGKKHGPNNPLL